MHPPTPGSRFGHQMKLHRNIQHLKPPQGLRVNVLTSHSANHQKMTHYIPTFFIDNLLLLQINLIDF